MSKIDQSRRIKHKILLGHFIINRDVSKLGDHLGGTIMQLSVAGN